MGTAYGERGRNMAATVEQARRLSEAAGVDVIAALSALERNDGDALAAMLELERQGLTPPPPGGGFYSTRSAGGGTPPPSGPNPPEGGNGTWYGGVLILPWSDVRERLKDFLHKCLSTRLEVWRRGRQAASVPLPILVVLLLFFFVEIAVVLGVGLLLGFRYRLSGPMVDGKGAQGFLASIRDAFARFRDRLRR